jgi:very-short-patch-repair endonuclease
VASLVRRRSRYRKAYTPRRTKGYPHRPTQLIRRIKRGTVKWDMLRQPRPIRHRRPWRYSTRLNIEAYQEGRAAQNVRGSLQERILYKALEDHALISGIDFTFQTAMLGGRAEFGGLVADFVFEVPKVIVQVQSVWHTTDLEATVRDSDQNMLLQSWGYTVLEIWPTSIMDETMLDRWIEQNIMTLWGTSRGVLGVVGTPSNVSYVDYIIWSVLGQINSKLTDVISLAGL